MAAVVHRPAVRHEQHDDYFNVNYVKRKSIELALGASLVNTLWNAYHIKVVQTAINGSLAGAIILVHDEVERGLTANLVQDAEDHVTNARDAAREARAAFNDIQTKFDKAMQIATQQFHDNNAAVVEEHTRVKEELESLKTTKESLDLTVEEQKKQVAEQKLILEGLKRAQGHIENASKSLSDHARSLSNSQIVQLDNGGNNQK